MTHGEEPRLRRATRSDWPDIRALLASALPENPKIAPEVMEWQYGNNPFGEAISFVHECDAGIVSHFSRLPVPMRIGGRMTMGSIAVDAATDRDYRGRGLWLGLVETSDRACVSRGIETDLAFRARSSVLPRYSIRVHSPLARLVLPVDPSWVGRRSKIPLVVARMLVKKFRSPPVASVQESSTSAPDIDTLWKQIEPHLGSSVTKDGTWWAWRFDAHPHRPYRHFVLREDGVLRAAAVVRLRRHGDDFLGEILEFFTADPDAGSMVVSHMVGALGDVAALMFVGPRRSHSSRALTSAGFRVLPRFLDPDPLSLNMRDFCDNRAALEDADWDVTLSDVDHL